jgi:hypothetical protein
MEPNATGTREQLAAVIVRGNDSYLFKRLIGCIAFNDGGESAAARKP